MIVAIIIAIHINTNSYSYNNSHQSDRQRRTLASARLAKRERPTSHPSASRHGSLARAGRRG